MKANKVKLHKSLNKNQNPLFVFLSFSGLLFTTMFSADLYADENYGYTTSSERSICLDRKRELDDFVEEHNDTMRYWIKQVKNAPRYSQDYEIAVLNHNINLKEYKHAQRVHYSLYHKWKEDCSWIFEQEESN